MEHWLAWKNRVDGAKGETDAASLAKDLYDYLTGSYDKYRHCGLAQRLSRLAEPIRVLLIQSAIDQNPELGLKFAQSCLHQPKYFEIILIHALEIYDERTLDLWLKCVISTLKHSRVLQILEQHVDAYPEAAVHLFYIMPRIPWSSSAGYPIYNRLRQILIAKSLIADDALYDMTSKIKFPRLRGN